MTYRPIISRRGFLASLGAAATALYLPSCSAPTAPLGSTSTPTILDSPFQAKRVSLLMIGDVLVHEGVWMSGERADGSRNYDHLFANIKENVAAADIAIVNQETVLGGTELGLSGYPAFNSPQEIGDAAAAAGFNVVLGATNHALDGGMEAIRSECGFWRTKHPDVLVVGRSDSEEAYDELPILEVDGVRVGILNYTESTNGIPLREPFATRVLDEELVRADAARLREAGVDAIVACPHWGTEYVLAPTDAQRRWASVFLELGVAAIIGTHPHVIEPVEVLENAEGIGAPVFWSLGNFVSLQAQEQCMIGGMAELTLVKDADGCRVEGYSLTPVITQYSIDTELTAYKLADYTEELAARNGIRRVAGSDTFTRAWCVDFCADVLGEGFDRERAVLSRPSGA